jgi:hypothetical protein
LKFSEYKPSEIFFFEISKMKVIIFLLAALCSVYADHHEAADPCLQQCKEQMKTKLQGNPAFAKMSPDALSSKEGRTKMRQFMRQYIDGTGEPPAKLTDQETWTKMCTFATEGENCINQCPDSEKKEGAKKFLSLFKLGCSDEFKNKVGCLVEVKKTPNQECQAKCTPLAQPLKNFLDERDRDPDNMVLAPKDVLEATCKFTNCRLNCRKNDIVQKCEQAGFEQAKKWVSALASSSKMLYKRVGGDLNNWPEICKSDKVIEAHDY